MSVTTYEIIKVTGNKMINFQQKFPVYENTIVELKGEFHSVGKTNSIIYFGLHCFREDGKDILCEDINRKKESLLITSVNTDMKGITLEKKPETWNNSTETNDENYYKLIGIYFDGNIDRLPDYLIKSPAYKTYENNNIILNEEIPQEIYDKIIPFKTRVMNHYYSGTFDYSAACNACVGEQWTEFKAVYNGFSNGYGDIKGNFRLGTKQISPFILANYHQNNDAVLEIRNIELNIKEKLKMI